VIGRPDLNTTTNVRAGYQWEGGYKREWVVKAVVSSRGVQHVRLYTRLMGFADDRHPARADHAFSSSD
jgi:hypothetical protein